ncbi:Gamma-glutamyltranspeptidase [Naegleria gruberi]|uniref:Gamma-glutamyltranspeptidase n=1 Tax=Naegleria gruberi TaxID=5762 RepID=D2VJF0_NAEGR|nr:Gamma-glutamyltranspeptidase [Naegleria gruberi]EFC42931.1 Gamma-glutamyltranspeptidase [Naegleria gruberi]|eukprot:XP_002675675.1 Gamma-glutamyltranspeptidase [Naegleria gruberi strain NEG-M]
MGLKVIKEKKGNAVDAAIVVALCLGVTRPFASGIGGGGFITIFMNETKTVDFINSRETAPSAASQDMYENNYDESVFGGKSIAVYGEIRGLHTAHKLYGKLPWKELFTDVINIARNGWIVEPLLARTDLANTLEKIASDGPNILYEGPIAQKIVEEIQQQGGIITLDDLKNYQPERPFYDENPIISQKDMTLELNDFKVILPPPPSAGPVIKFILSILNNFKIGDNSPMGLNYHYILEALKFGFGHRSNLGDVNFLPKENVTKYIINQLLSDSYASSIASERVSPSRTFPWSHYYSDNYAPVKDKGTSHFSVIDEDGNSVAMTTTVNHNFGSKVASASTGIVFNNQMNDFTVDLHKPNQFGLPPSAANVIAPGKRPLSSMSPAIFLDKSGNRVKYIIGASGGPTIISAIIEVFYSIEKFKVQPNLAVALPRLHAQPGSDVVKMEEGFNRQVITALQEKGHTFEPVQILPDGHTIGCCQVIQVSSTENDQNLFLPGTDPRKLGSPACF